MNKKKKIAIITFLAISAIALAVYFATSRPQTRHGKLNTLKDVKIFVGFANANRISMEIFFPLKDEVIIPGTYELEQKASNGKWKTVKKAYSYDTDDLENTSVLSESIYDACEETSKDEKYKDIGYGTQIFEFIERYGSLEAGTYRVIFPVRKDSKRYDLSAEFSIDREYEYTDEPENSIATTTSYLELIPAYEACLASGEYVTYGDFPLGFQNRTFTKNLYTHLSGMELSLDGKKKPVAQNHLKKTYEYLASSILSRQGKSVYGSTLFSNDDDLSFNPLRSNQKDEASKKDLTLSLTFDYDGKKKEISCTINGHRLKVETTDFFFDEEASSILPWGEPEPITEKNKGTGISAEFYVYNELYGKMMEILENE